ncbi:MAG: LacI family DNA-binding transcriptional regulator [bacterium]
MNKKRIKGGARLRDVAMAAGVSNATVSAVANGRADKYGICLATQEKVKVAIRQLGYSPSLAALDMVAGRNSLVGLAISDDFPAADHRMAALEPFLAQAGFRVILAFLPPDPQAATARITSLIQFGVSGLVIFPAESIVLPKLNCPAVMVGRPGAGVPAVYEDEVEGGRRLARRLLDKGHRRIAILGNQQPNNSATSSSPATPSPAVNGFLAACAQVGATVRSFHSVSEFLPMAETMTAVFCVTPAALLELYSRGSAGGLRLGTDLAVVAVDSLGVAANLMPRPTVLQPGIAQLGQAVAQSIQQAIQGVVPGDVRLEPVIFDGETITALPLPSSAEPVSNPGPAVAPQPSVSASVPPPVKPIMPVNTPPSPVSPPPVVAPKPTPVPAHQTSIPVIIPTTPEPSILPSETFQMPETVISGPTVPVSDVVAAASGEPVEPIPGGTVPQQTSPAPEIADTPPMVHELTVPFSPALVPDTPPPAVPTPVPVSEPVSEPVIAPPPASDPEPEIEVAPTPESAPTPEPSPPAVSTPTEAIPPPQVVEPVPPVSTPEVEAQTPVPLSEPIATPPPIVTEMPPPQTPEPPVIVPPPETQPSAVSTPEEVPAPSQTPEGSSHAPNSVFSSP